jgi:glycosyltransferase involved in cell wall biosynthesis
MTTKGTVAVLLATYNGAEFLSEQIDSLASQDFESIDIWMSDNGSDDATVDIARKKAASWKKGRFTISKRQRSRDDSQEWLKTSLLRSRDNFSSLIMNEDIEADYYAYCDQDDIWESSKLSTAIAKIRQADADKPIMYCARTKIIDEHGNFRHLSIRFRRKPGFRNAIVQNIASGNTIVLNRKAMKAIRRNSASQDFVSHDWWTYIVVTALGGVALYDPEPLTRYRQHGANVIGENASWRARLARSRFLLQGRFRKWNHDNIEAMEKFVDAMPQENRVTLSQFKSINRSGPVTGLCYLVKSGIYRQTLLGQISLYLGCLLGKI